MRAADSWRSPCASGHRAAEPVGHCDGPEPRERRGGVSIYAPAAVASGAAVPHLQLSQPGRQISGVISCARFPQMGSWRHSCC